LPHPVDLRLLEVTEERNGPSGLRDDDDDDYVKRSSNSDENCMRRSVSKTEAF